MCRSEGCSEGNLWAESEGRWARIIGQQVSMIDDRTQYRKSCRPRSFSCGASVHHGHVNWPWAVTVVWVPLLANAVATTSTVAEIPATHCTVTVPVPVETMFATVRLLGFATMNCPLYGAVNVTGPLSGGMLNWPVAVKVTCPLEEVNASAVAGVTLIAVKTRKEFGLDEAQENRAEIRRVRTVRASSRQQACIFNLE